jgi:hypothetical protein
VQALQFKLQRRIVSQKIKLPFVQAALRQAQGFALRLAEGGSAEGKDEKVG